MEESVLKSLYLMEIDTKDAPLPPLLMERLMKKNGVM